MIKIKNSSAQTPFDRFTAVLKQVLSVSKKDLHQLAKKPTRKK
jgi:hypothetical protein